jgi:hypothetical protein
MTAVTPDVCLDRQIDAQHAVQERLKGKGTVPKINPAKKWFMNSPMASHIAPSSTSGHKYKRTLQTRIEPDACRKPRLNAISRPVVGSYCGCAQKGCSGFRMPPERQTDRRTDGQIEARWTDMQMAQKGCSGFRMPSDRQTGTQIEARWTDRRAQEKLLGLQDAIRQTDRQTVSQTDRRTDRQTDRQTDRSIQKKVAPGYKTPPT